MRCHVRTLLKMIDNVMNLSLPLPAYLIFTVSFQTYIVLHNHRPDGPHQFFLNLACCGSCFPHAILNMMHILDVM